LTGVRERAGQRLSELRAEYEAGEKMLAKLDADRTDVEQTLMRISGAIQVLEELIAQEDDPTPEGAQPTPP
jgi:hypothetical protein